MGHGVVRQWWSRLGSVASTNSARVLSSGVKRSVQNTQSAAKMKSQGRVLRPAGTGSLQSKASTLTAPSAPLLSTASLSLGRFSWRSVSTTWASALASGLVPRLELRLASGSRSGSDLGFGIGSGRKRRRARIALVKVGDHHLVGAAHPRCESRNAGTGAELEHSHT